MVIVPLVVLGLGIDLQGTGDEGFGAHPENCLKVDAKYHSHKEPNIISDNHVW